MPHQTQPALADAWACPVHSSTLTEQSGKLICPSGHAYEIINGIPRFVAASTYADHFGLQWNTYRTTQLDSYTGTSLTRDRTRRCLGEELWNSIAGKRVLECGCGAGRFTEVLLERGANVTSVDLSSAIDANAHNFPVSPTHRAAQADISHLPVPERSFDVVLCLGVLQHTPSTKPAIASLYSRVAPGGSLVIDHYPWHIGWRWYTRTAPWFRSWYKRRPPAKALAATERLVVRLLPWHKRMRRSRVASAVLNHLSPLMSYYRTRPELDDKLQREWALLDTHDALTCWHLRFRTRNQIARTLAALGMVEIWCEYGGNGVEARGRRPRD